MRVTLKHTKFGVLFTYVVNASGSLIYQEPASVALSPQQIVSELSRYGFLIEYICPPTKDISSSQLEYLMTLDGLHYDKIRFLSVYTDKGALTSYVTVPSPPPPEDGELYWNDVNEGHAINSLNVAVGVSAQANTATYVVAFKIAQNPAWLNNKYCATWNEFCNALADGSAINLTAISKFQDYSWGWMQNSVLSIKDIIQEVAEA